MLRIAIVIGSTRPGRLSGQVAQWVYEHASAQSSAEQPVEYTLVDLADAALPFLDEPVAALFGDYRHEHTRRWSETVAPFDGFIFVVPEYNHGMPAVLKNAIDYLYTEWNDKAAGFVSYGFNGGARAIEQLRLVLSEVKVATVRSQVTLNMFQDFTFAESKADPKFVPAEHQPSVLDRMLGDLLAWTEALAPLRVSPASASS